MIMSLIVELSRKKQRDKLLLLYDKRFMHVISFYTGFVIYIITVMYLK